MWLYLFQAGIKEDQLLIALEPEAASLYCKHLPVERLQSDGGAQGFATFAKGSKYLVLDCGGIVLQEFLLFHGIIYLLESTGGCYLFVTWASINNFHTNWNVNPNIHFYMKFIGCMIYMTLYITIYRCWSITRLTLVG